MRDGGKFLDINRGQKRRTEQKEKVSKSVSTYSSRTYTFFPQIVSIFTSSLLRSLAIL